MRNSTPRHAAAKEAPRVPKDFPLWWHKASRRWARKVKGKVHYFGPDPDAALEEWLRVKDHLLAGRRPPPVQGGTTIMELAGRFLESRERKVAALELKPKSFESYHGTMRRMVAVFGENRIVADLGPRDFAELRADFAKRHGPARLAVDVQECRTCFKWGVENDVISNLPKFGDFKRPPARVLRATRNAVSKMMEPAELRAMIDAAPIVLRCFILLGLNCAFGPYDLASLPRRCVDLKRGWVVYPRPKTAVARKAWLWPESVAALQEYEAVRHEPARPDFGELFFLTRSGAPYCRGARISRIRYAFRRLAEKLEIHRPGVSPYSLRHCFRHAADASLDGVAAAVVMGHVDLSIAGVYRGDVADDRIRRVCEAVRSWLYAADPAEGDDEQPATIPFRAKVG